MTTTKPWLDRAWLDAHWMPFTGNRQFKASPRMFVGAEGAYLIDADGKRVFDGLSGLWCAGLGHCRREIVEAVQRQVATLDYAPAFQFGHPTSFELANRIKALTPAGLDHVFFVGSDRGRRHLAQDRARLLAAQGQGHQTRLIGRERLPASTSAASPSVASSATASCTARASTPITCRTPSWRCAIRRRRSPAASPRSAPTSPTRCSISSRCTTPPASPR
ncbi:MAG: aminotransferase class III-fold pyridoxal phosphate-dependent enzyme [Kofleriaceae bacterium]